MADLDIVNGSVFSKTAAIKQKVTVGIVEFLKKGKGEVTWGSQSTVEIESTFLIM